MPGRHLLSLYLLLVGAMALATPRTGFVDPVDTDPAIRALLELPGAAQRDLRHFVAVDAARRNGFLYVHLPGSGGLPENSQQVIVFAAEQGYQAVSLAYPNWPSVRELTAALGDADAPGAVREERIYGIDSSPLVEVDLANGVLNRLLRLLQWLDLHYPEEGWHRFHADGQLQWSRIVVGGHSQGAGHAAYLAQDFSLAGALMFGGPGDWVNGAGIANWLLRPLHTSVSALHGFVHQKDPNYDLYQLTQATLGLDASGPTQDVDLVAATEWRSNRLSSSRSDIPDGNYHGAVVVDAALPPAPDGGNGYAPAWQYLFGVVQFRADFED